MMANLTTIDKKILEHVFQMWWWYVLDFTNASFADFFRDDLGIDIYDVKYDYWSGSKANLLRWFWLKSDDALVGKCVLKMVDYIEAFIESEQNRDISNKQLQKAKEIGNRLLGINVTADKNSNIDSFLDKDFADVSINTLHLDIFIEDILKERIEEIKQWIKHDLSLATIFLCWSTLEWLLLAISQKFPKKFNTSKSAPKKDWKVLQFSDWSLETFINVSKDVWVLDEDVRKYSHALRDFRNYIHPYHQASQSFYPTKETAKLSRQVLKTSMIQIKKFIEKHNLNTYL